jgi:mannose-6-phosphate isomerase-like protein (cupin superfamily)
MLIDRCNMANEITRRRLITSTSAALTLPALVSSYNPNGDQPGNKPFLVRKGEAHDGRPIVVQGDPDAFATKVSGVDGNKAYSVIEVQTPPSRGPLLHIHPSQNELFIVSYGSIGIQCGQERTVLNAGDTFMVPAKMPHTFVSLGKEKSRILNIFDPPGEMERFFADLAAVLNEHPDEKKLTDVYTRHNIRVVGPPLEASSFPVPKG